MKLAFYDDFKLGVIRDDRIANAMSAIMGMSFRRPQDMIEEVIINWDEMRPRNESAIQGQEGLPLGSVRLRAPVPRPPKLIWRCGQLPGVRHCGNQRCWTGSLRHPTR